MSQSAFVLRMAPGYVDRMSEALDTNELIVGWAQAEGLLDPNLRWEEFRDIIRRYYYAEDQNLRRAGNAVGHLWRFIREMKPGDLVVVPYGAGFYVAEVCGPATYDPSKIQDDAAYKRPVRWLNDGKPIPRNLARSALISCMKTQGTCADATHLLDEIRECLELARSGEVRTFEADLQKRLIAQVLSELHSGRMDSFGFERLIRTVLLGLGAREVRIVSRHQDKGADLLATFPVAGVFPVVVAIQAKHCQPEPPVSPEVVEQLVRGIEAEQANFGMVITSGSISEESKDAAERYFEEKGTRIELVDGEQFAKLVVEYGLRTS